LSEAGRPLDIRVGSTPEATLVVSAAERRMRATRGQWLGLVAIAGAGVAADQVTKAAIRSTLSVDEIVHVAGPFSLRHVWNSGIAFGMFAGALPVVIALTIAALGWMLLFFARSGARHPLLAPAIGLLTGGSVGNLVDRLRVGHVTDFLDIRWWPTFNLADAFITIGVALLLVVVLLGDRSRPVRTAPDPGAPGL
jgi:signal peptidase II